LNVQDKPEQNIDSVLCFAEHVLDIPPVFEAKEFIDTPDEFAMAIFLTYIFRVCAVTVQHTTRERVQERERERETMIYTNISKVLMTWSNSLHDANRQTTHKKLTNKTLTRSYFETCSGW
jgi:hypothetical protein